MHFLFLSNSRPWLRIVSTSASKSYMVKMLANFFPKLFWGFFPMKESLVNRRWLIARLRTEFLSAATSPWWIPPDPCWPTLAFRNIYGVVLFSQRHIFTLCALIYEIQIQLLFKFCLKADLTAHAFGFLAVTRTFWTIIITASLTFEERKWFSSATLTIRRDTSRGIQKITKHIFTTTSHSEKKQFLWAPNPRRPPRYPQARTWAWSWFSITCQSRWCSNSTWWKSNVRQPTTPYSSSSAPRKAWRSTLTRLHQ